MAVVILSRRWPGLALCLTLAVADAWSAVPRAVPGEVLVRWEFSPVAKAGTGGPSADAAAAESLSALERRYGPIRWEALFPAPASGRPVAGPAHLQRQRLFGWSHLRVDAEVEPERLAAEVARMPAVAEAQPNYLRTPCYTPDDPLVGDQWSLVATGWLAARPPNARGIIVGVVDSGVGYDHPDLRDQIWRNVAEWRGDAGRDDDGNGYVDDVMGWDFADAPGLAGSGDYLDRDADPYDESGHGTHVAGIIAAGVGNGVGIAGLAPSVQLMVLRAGFNATGGGYLADDDVAAAVVYGVENGAHVLNLSFGDPNPSPVLRDALAYAHAAGVTIVAAAGNGGEEGVLYPARFSEAIAVSAVTESGAVASFSSWGYEVDVAAPGLQIRSLALGGGYADLSGTSMAAAHVSGLSALILARQPHLQPLQVRAALTATARDAALAGWDPWTGHGVATASPPPQGPAGARFAYPASGEAVAGAVETVLEVAGPEGGNTWSVAWSRRDEDVWRELEGSVAATGPSLGFRLPDLAPGEYVLRAERSDSPASPMTRSWTFVPFTATAQAPVVSGLSWSRVVQGGSWAELVEWRTDRPAGGEVRLSGMGGALVLPVPAGRTDQWLVLPGDLTPGPYELIVDADGTDRASIALAVVVGERGLVSLPGQSLAVLPDGYLLPEFTDFDGDGRPEIATMAASEAGYGATTLYELDGSEGWAAAHTTSQTFIPWTTGDLDGDGLQEIMAVDAERVRLLEAVATDGFPVRVAWEQRGVWGGAVGDLDGDGRPEMHLRSSRGDLVRVFENQGDDQYEEVALLANPTDGDNEAGERFVLGDLDGDGAQEVLLGDSDGDLMVYASAGDDALRWEWSGQGPGGDSRLVGGGADLDGDGRAEVAVGAFTPDLLDPAHSLWTVVVYEVDAGGKLRPEWDMTVLGGRTTRNGIGMGDLDGDGLPELVLGLPPNLYVVRAGGPDQYEPVWWAAADSPRRAAAGDVDGDGMGELVFSAVGEIAVTRFPRALDHLPAPARVEAYALSGRRIVLKWEAVAAAAHYLVRRDRDSAEASVDSVVGTTYMNDPVEAGAAHTYEVAAVTASGAVGLWSPPARASGEAAPRIVQAERLSPTTVAVHFDSAMGPSAAEAHRYYLEPGSAVATSAVLDRGARRAVVGFPLWPQEEPVFLAAAGLRSTRGTPMAAEAARAQVVNRAAPTVTRLLSAEALSGTEIRLRFSAPLDPALDNAAAVLVDGGAIEVVALRLAGAAELVAELAPHTPLLALGVTYPVRVSGLRDGAGRRIEGHVELTLTVSRLDRVVAYPNPFDPRASALTIAPVPGGTAVTITTLTGQKVWAAEAGAAGGVRWDGTNRAGRRVRAGIYLYHVTDGDTRRLGKIAVVNEQLPP